MDQLIVALLMVLLILVAILIGLVGWLIVRMGRVEFRVQQAGLVLSAFMLTTSRAGGEQMGPLLPVVDPESETRAAVAFLESNSVDGVYTAFISTYAVPPDLDRWYWLQRLWFRQLTRNPNRRNFPLPVPGSDTLYWFDLRSFDFNDFSWRAVGLRDKAFREPWIDSKLARRFRMLVAEKQPANFSLVRIVDAWGLYRRTYQTLETSDYYDLLFSAERFPLDGGYEQREVRRYWPGGAYQGRNYPEGWYDYLEQFPTRKFVDFPADADQWLGAFLGGLKVAEFKEALKRTKATRGAVRKGSEDVRVGGSFVARNNRELWFQPVPNRLSAIFSQSFDVNTTAGKRDLEENAFTDQDRDKERVFQDGGELLITLPAGDGLASLVINAQRKRVEVVPSVIAIHTRDPRDRSVRNGPLVCFGCHADAYGWIPVPNVIEETADEVDTKFKDIKKKFDGRQAAEDFDAFFIGWQDELRGSREITRTYWQQATNPRDPDNGITGVQFGQLSLQAKWRYDDSLVMSDMVRETGLSEPILRLTALRSTLRRAVDAVRRAEVPRATWDADVFAEIMKLSVSKKERVTP